MRVSGTAENRFLAPRNEFWGPRAQRQARLKTGPQRFPVALSQEIIAHLTFSLFLKFLGCYSELPEAPENEEMEETMNALQYKVNKARKDLEEMTGALKHANENAKILRVAFNQVTKIRFGRK